MDASSQLILFMQKEKAEMGIVSSVEEHLLSEDIKIKINKSFLIFLFINNN